LTRGAIARIWGLQHNLVSSCCYRNEDQRRHMGPCGSGRSLHVRPHRSTS